MSVKIPIICIKRILQISPAAILVYSIADYLGCSGINAVISIITVATALRKSVTIAITTARTNFNKKIYIYGGEQSWTAHIPIFNHNLGRIETQRSYGVIPRNNPCNIINT